MTDAPHTPHSSSNGGTPRDGREQVDRFFNWIRSSGITRGSDRWLAGVCGGIARRTGLDPMIVRGIAIVLAILGGPVLIAYALGWAFLPNADGRIHAEQLFHGVFEPAIVVIIALVTFTFLPFTRGLWWQGAPAAWGMPDWLATTLAVGWAIAVTIGIVWLVVYLMRRVPAPGYHGAAGYGFGPGAPASATGAPTGATDDAAGDTGSAAASAGSATAFGGSAAAFGGPAWTFAGSAPGFAGSAPGFAAPASSSPLPPSAPPRPDGQAPRSAWDAWQEQNRHWQAQNRAWRAEQRAQRSSYRWGHRHPGAGYTAIVLGIALAAGGVAAGVYAAGTWSNAALLTGVAVALGVLALGIIVSGIRGRDSGAMGGFAFLAVLTLLFVGVFPQGTQFSPFGDNHWVVSSAAVEASPGYAMVAGNPTVDLSNLTGSPRSDGRPIDVWIGFGATEVILPSDRSVRVETNAIIGGVDYGANNGSDHGGLFFHDSRSLSSTGNSSVSTRPVAQIRIWSLVGQVNVHTKTE